MEIKNVSLYDLRKMNGSEGLILQGCGGDLQEWVDGINEMNCQPKIGQKLFSRIASFKLNGREITERAVDAKIIEPMNIISEFKF